MSLIRNYLLANYKTYLGLLAVVVAGMLTNFIGAFAVFLVFFILLKNNRLEFLLLSFLLVFFLGDNVRNALSFANNLRFLMIGFSLIFLIQFHLLQDNFGRKILLFSLYGLMITILFSPLGLNAASRAIAYLMMALIVFKLVEQLYKTRDYEVDFMLVSFLFVFITLNFITIIFFGNENFYLVGRFKGLMNNPNGLGLLLMLSFAILDYFKKVKPWIASKRVFNLFNIALIVMVILSGSRTALFSIIIYYIVSNIFDNKRLLASFIFLGIPIFYIIVSVDLIEILISLGLEERLRVETISSGSGRSEVWEVAWEEIKMDPIWGKGMMYDNFFIDEYRTIYIGENGGRQWSGVWNSYLSLLLNVGIVGLVIYLMFLINCFLASYYKSLAFAFLMMVLASGVTESWMAASMNAFTPLLFLYFALQMQTEPTFQE